MISKPDTREKFEKQGHHLVVEGNELLSLAHIHTPCTEVCAQTHSLSSSSHSPTLSHSHAHARTHSHTHTQGVPGISRAVISKPDTREKFEKQGHHLVVEGNELLQVMATPGIDGLRAVSNHVMEMERTLGIEAAR